MSGMILKHHSPVNIDLKQMIPVIVQNCVESMSNCKNCAVSKLCPDGFLRMKLWNSNKVDKNVNLCFMVLFVLSVGT